MKKIINAALASLLLISCETESHTVKNAPGDNLLDNPALKGKLLQLSQYPSAIDNIIDGTSCFAINLPVTVIANGQTITIGTVADYQQIRNIFSASDTDTDAVILPFPVSVTYADYTGSILHSQPELDAAIATCTASVELSCISLQYPLTIKAYDTARQFAETFSLGSKKALFEFVRDNDYGAAALSFPMWLTVPDGSIVAVENNTELASAIDNFADDCIALLDPVTVAPALVFDEVIVQGSWHVSYFFRDTESTADYAAYDFTFNANATITGTPAFTGTWDSYSDSGELKAAFAFSSSSLNELEEDWNVVAFSASLIKMEHESGGGNAIRYCYFQRN